MDGAPISARRCSGMRRLFEGRVYRQVLCTALIREPPFVEDGAFSENAKPEVDQFLKMVRVLLARSSKDDLPAKWVE